MAQQLPSPLSGRWEANGEEGEEFFEKNRWLFEKQTPRGALHLSLMLLFKLLLCIILVLTTDKVQAVLLVCLYLSRVVYTAVEQPYIRHRRGQSDFGISIMQTMVTFLPLLLVSTVYSEF